MSKLIMVKEELFTDSMTTLHEVLDKSINVLDIDNLKIGVPEDRLENTIQNLKLVNDVLEELSEKRFDDALLSLSSLEIRIKYIK